MQPLVSIIIIGYNSKKFLKTCFDAILAQTYRDLELIFIDNNSSDDSVEWTRQVYASHITEGSEKRITVIKNINNIGYTGAANQGIRISKGEYVVITNPDIIYTSEYFEKAIAHMEDDEKIAALTGKIIKYDFEKENESGSHGAPGQQTCPSGATNLIDTVGLAIFRSRRVIDDGQGLPDDGRFDTDANNGGHQVFGISGACPIYRRTALDDVKLTVDALDGGKEPEYLDGNFFMYKEDVDLSWRFTLLGWKCWYDPRAVAYHGRGTGVKKRFTVGQMVKERDGLSPFQKTYSYRNHRLMQLKNELWGNFWHDFFYIAAREIGSLIYVTFREPYIWKSIWQMIKLIPSTLRKRRQIMARVEDHWRHRGGMSAAAKEMQQWFVEKSKYVE